MKIRPVRTSLVVATVIALAGFGPVATAGSATPRAEASGCGGLGLLPRVLTWSGETWLVEASSQNGPEKVPLSNACGAVYVDSKGRLHLKITKINGVWRSVELESLSAVSYGTYRITVATPTADFDPWTVLGLFVFRPGSKPYTHEIDIEDSRFPNLLRAPNNAQFAVQPYRARNHEHGYQLKKSYARIIQQFSWHPGRASFSTRLATTSPSRLIARWHFRGADVPVANGMRLYLNLWTNQGKPPLHGTHTAVIDSFSHTPAL